MKQLLSLSLLLVCFAMVGCGGDKSVTKPENIAPAPTGTAEGSDSQTKDNSGTGTATAPPIVK